MLKVTDLDAGYGELQVLWRASIEVNDREIVGILGPNAAGKSTLLNCVAGLVRAKAGRVEFDSVDCTHWPAYRRPSLGVSLVLERRRLFPMMSVRDNLLVGSYSPKARQHRGETLDWVLDLFPALKSKMNVRAQQLSGGEQQMVAIARSLMSRPRLLMVDEPYLGLAPGVVETVKSVFRELRSQGICILFIEQLLELALSTASRVYVMADGRIVLSEECSAEGLRERIEDIYFGAAQQTGPHGRSDF